MVRPRSDAIERDRGRPPYIEPFAAMFWRLRVSQYLLGIGFAVVLIQGVLLYRAAAHASAHVYEVHPDGKAVYIGDREANLAPRRVEAERVARDFCLAVYAWNSSTVADDLSEAVNLSSAAFGRELRSELAAAGFVGNIRDRRVRSQVEFEEVTIVEHSRNHSIVRVRGKSQLFSLTDYRGSPKETRPFHVQLTLQRTDRDPIYKTNGLEVVAMHNLVGSKQGEKP